jgi:hypothetical protein
VKEMSALMEAHIAEAEILLPQKNENYAGNVAAGWLGSDDTEVSVKDRIMRVKSSGNEPWVETVYTPNIFDATFALTFEMKSASRGTGAVSWTCHGQNRDEITGSTTFNAIHDGNWHVYRTEMPLTGILNTLRIIPGRGPGDIQIRNIRLVTRDGYYIRDWPLY